MTDADVDATTVACGSSCFFFSAETVTADAAADITKRETTDLFVVYLATKSGEHFSGEMLPLFFEQKDLHTLSDSW